MMRYGQLIFEGACVFVVLALWCALYAVVEPPTRAGTAAGISMQEVAR